MSKKHKKKKVERVILVVVLPEPIKTENRLGEMVAAFKKALKEPGESLLTV